MKNIFSLLLVCSSYLSFGQMTVSDMIKIHSMNMDNFESYVLGKGFIFDKIEEDENYEGHSYTKGTGENTKYLTLYTKYFDLGKNVSYQTSNSNEILNFKNQMKTIGFVLHHEEIFQGHPVKYYRNNKYDIQLISGKNEMNKNNFTIGLNKY